jgi:hypothetical protein
MGVEFFGFNSANKLATAIEIANANHILIEGNSFRNWNDGISVNASSNIVVGGNSFLNDTNSTYEYHVLVDQDSNRVNIHGNTFSGNYNTLRSVIIAHGTYNLTGMNTWTGPYLNGGGFYSNLYSTSNIDANNVGN